MRQRGPYVRPSLTATRDGVPDPAIEVEAWLDDLETTLSSEGPDWSPHGAYDLLAGWARLKRARPDLVQNLEGENVLDEAQALLAGRGQELSQLALTVPDPEAWRDETAALDASYERLIDPVERSTFAEMLITDLDDAELVLYALEHLGVSDSELGHEIEECRVWLMEHADLFLAAGVHVQAVGMALRPDLSEYDYSLALTALKYERLLDEAEEVEAELSLDRLERIEQEVFDALRRRFERELISGAAVMAFPRSLLQAARLAAAAETRSHAILKWKSPDSLWIAYLPISTEIGTLTIRFYHEYGERGASLSGHPVFLAGVAGYVDSEGRAEFLRERLEASEQDLRLEVGEPKVTWLPELE